MDHKECVKRLMEIGSHFGFKATGKSYGKKYELGNPDCVWYYTGKGAKELSKIARGERYRYLPFIAFEVAYSEREKNLRGSLVALQLTNAAAGVIVLLGKSVDRKRFLKKLIGRYSYMRFRIWTENDVNEIYKRIEKTVKVNSAKRK